MTRALCAVGVALAIVAGHASSARACSVAPGFVPSPDHTDTHWAIAAGVLTAVDGTLIGLAIGAGDEMFSPELAAIELTLGALQITAAPFVLMTSWSVSSCGTSSSNNLPIGVGYGFGLGGWLLAHGIWSLSDRDPPPVVPIVSADDQHVALHVLGTF